MAGTSMNDIKARIKSVRSTMQITKAMELVATSKLRRAKERAQASRPFCEVTEQVICSLLSNTQIGTADFAREGTQGDVLYVVVAGDRGLAGGFNANLFRLAAAHAADEDATVRFLPIGKKAVEYYRRHTGAMREDYPLVSTLGVGDALRLSRQICDEFRAGKWRRVQLVFTQFVSMLTQTPVCRPLLPLPRPDERAHGNVPAPYTDEEEAPQVLDRIVPEYLGGILYAAIAESLAAESGARRCAMSNANKNASEMIDELGLRFNRARQAIITQEITEIVSGAEAL